jgi:hypothetical protein
MNLNDPRHPWARLTAAARQVHDDRDTTTPYGFATRVAALGFAQQGKTVSLVDLFALRALGVAALVAVLGVAVNYHVFSPASAPTTVVAVDSNEALLPTVDAVAVLGLDVAD